MLRVEGFGCSSQLYSYTLFFFKVLTYIDLVDFRLELPRFRTPLTQASVVWVHSSRRHTRAGFRRRNQGFKPECQRIVPHFGSATEMGSSLNEGPFWCSVYKGAVLYWGPKRGPEFRELPKSKLQESCQDDTI